MGGLRVQGLRVSGLGFRIECQVEILEFRAFGLGCRHLEAVKLDHWVARGVRKVHEGEGDKEGGEGRR